MMTAHDGNRERRRERVGTWVVRIAFALVFVINVQCALQFAIWPEAFASAYELGGVPGEAAVRGMGITFLMWNVTYPPFIASPRRFAVLGWVILAQQAVGLIGESALLLTLPAGHDMLASSVMRFIAFDAAGLVVMLAAQIAARKIMSNDAVVRHESPVVRDK